MKKIIITGATGSIGQKLTKKLTERGYNIVVFTRNSDNAQKKLSNVYKVVQWDYNHLEEWVNELDNAAAVIHLAGANLGAKRWNSEYKKQLYDSRIISTRNLVEAIKSLEQKPKAFICASAVGYYGDRADEILKEDSTKGNDFLAKLCCDWEIEAKQVEQLGVRQVSVRNGLVLMKDEGVIKQLLLPFKFFLGGSLGNGKQWFPWIHIDDIVGIYMQSIENENLSGAINAASPGIVRMKEFANTFGSILKRPSFFSIPKFAVKIVAGEFGEYAVMSQRVSVEKILNIGYKFKFEKLEKALKDLLK
ncbi:MAG TPA: TIGR01777 family oxidoreductase [Ignavibacteriaceae bacterium]|nr:TIGR01777 family oxidoreductase [Ignavibacteriaceae bacterium]